MDFFKSLSKVNRLLQRARKAFSSSHNNLIKEKHEHYLNPLLSALVETDFKGIFYIYISMVYTSIEDRRISPYGSFVKMMNV